ncbi:MAG: hypothetical protein WCO60_18330 [Verrucomicrobiota bacterium]
MLIQGFNNVTALPAVTAGLLPAIHAATVIGSASLVSVSGNAGKVYRNTSGGWMVIPGTMGRSDRSIAANGFFGCDGRLLYPVEQEAGTNSFYPSEFSRELFSTFISRDMLQEGKTVRLSFALDLRTYVSNTMCQWALQLQIGQRAADTTPSPVGDNLQGFTWLPYSMRNVITFGSVSQQHLLGLQIQRLADVSGTVQYRASALKFNVLSACQAPTASDFVIRARLAQFDTENSVSDAKGFVAYQLSQGKVELA